MTPHRSGSRSRRWSWWRWEPAAWPGISIVIAYTLLGLGMIIQPARYARTPAYGNLITVLDIQVWGALYVVVGVLFLVYVRATVSRSWALLIHVLGFALTGAWLLALVIRYLTDPGTTNVTVVAWLTFLILIWRSKSLIPPITGHLPKTVPEP